jgi:hypothetical protein
MLREIKPLSKLANVFAWVNWLLSAVCIILFSAIIVFAYLKVDAKWEDKIYALIVLFVVFLFPTIFFLLNGLILKSKDGSQYDKERIDDF